MADDKWNWEREDWPNFAYKLDALNTTEQAFLAQSGMAYGIARHINEEDKQNITINLIENEAYKTSEIEGEILNRESLQSSIRHYFGYKSTQSKHPRESGIAEMMLDLYDHYEIDLTHDILYSWHAMLMNGRRDLECIGNYRTHKEPMQIISGAYGHQTVHFEAPPSQFVQNEMNEFIEWFNQTKPTGENPLPALTRASIAHHYFLAIHPFEDGNGRIGRALVEKILAQHIKRPTLIALSQIIQSEKKSYYKALANQNHDNEITPWLTYFSNVILRAQQYTIAEIEFLVQKARFFDRHKNHINDRQHKAIARIFEEGTHGFEGGLSAKNYIAITQTTASTATRDLHDLVKKGIFRKTGELKSTRYWLNLDEGR